MSSGITPVGNKVLVKVILVEEMSAGGIALPKSVTEKENIACMNGVVVGIGGACWQDYDGDDWCEIGDRVLFARHAGVVAKGIDEQDYRLLYDADIIAKAEDGVKI